MKLIITVILTLFVSCNAQIDDGRQLLESHEAQFAIEEELEHDLMMQAYSGEDEISVFPDDEDFAASSGPRKYTHEMEEEEPRFDAPHAEEQYDEEYAMTGDSSLVESDEILDALYNEPQQEERRHNLRRARKL